MALTNYCPTLRIKLLVTICFFTQSSRNVIGNQITKLLLVAIFKRDFRDLNLCIFYRLRRIKRTSAKSFILLWILNTCIVLLNPWTQCIYTCKNHDEELINLLSLARYLNDFINMFDILKKHAIKIIYMYVDNVCKTWRV